MPRVVSRADAEALAATGLAYLEKLSVAPTPLGVAQLLGDVDVLEGCGCAYAFLRPSVKALLILMRATRGMTNSVDGLEAELVELAKGLRLPQGDQRPVEDDNAPDDATYDKLHTTDKGGVTPTLRNVVCILDNDPRWVGRVRYDDFAREVMVDGKPLEDEVETEAVCWFADVYRINPAVDAVHNAMVAVAKRHKFHPVREYLDALKWDTTERLDTWLSDWCAVERTPDGLTALYGRRFLLAAVARIYEPGCKADNALVLYGPLQGEGKSTVFDILAGQWGHSSKLNMESKDGMQALQGVWLVELGEIDSLAKKDVSFTKSFLSDRYDRFRPPYGRNTQKFMRQNVFCGGTNKGSWLTDPTGNRRYWIRHVTGEIDLRALRNHRDDLFAEAVVVYKAGLTCEKCAALAPKKCEEHRWWLEGDEAKAQRADAIEYATTDPWDDVVTRWAGEWRGGVASTAHVLEKVLKIEPKDHKASEALRVQEILLKLGWEKGRTSKARGLQPPKRKVEAE